MLSTTISPSVSSSARSRRDCAGSLEDPRHAENKFHTLASDSDKPFSFFLVYPLSGAGLTLSDTVCLLSMAESGLLLMSWRIFLTVSTRVRPSSTVPWATSLTTCEQHVSRPETEPAAIRHVSAGDKSRLDT